MVVVVQLAERQIVALEVKSSILFDHPRNLNSFRVCQCALKICLSSLGCRQAVRHWTLTPTLRRFESYHPSQFAGWVGCPYCFVSDIKVCRDGVSPSGKAQDFDSCMRRFKSCHPSHIAFEKAKKFGLLAQLVEHLTFNQGVPGSSPG